MSSNPPRHIFQSCHVFPSCVLFSLTAGRRSVTLVTITVFQRQRSTEDRSGSLWAGFYLTCLLRSCKTQSKFAGGRIVWYVKSRGQPAREGGSWIKPLRLTY